MSNKKNYSKIFLTTTFAVALCAALFLLLDLFNLIPKTTYETDDFGIEFVYSSVDFNSNGVDDYTDIMLGARKDAKNRPAYDGSYQAGGYPPDDIGVCTDVVWRAFRNAGYSLRDMVDNDISQRLEKYTDIKKPDSNIDFRRVRNLRVFFEEYALSLTTDPYDIAAWQPGDIVIFDNDRHIGIISDKRNKYGIAYVIHNGGQPVREEDYLLKSAIVAHYRFDASTVDADMLIAWE